MENVKPYYQPLFKPTVTAGRHLYWSNFHIPLFEDVSSLAGGTGFFRSNLNVKEHKTKLIELYAYPNWLQKEDLGKNNQMLNNLVTPAVGKFIFEKSKL